MSKISGKDVKLVVVACEAGMGSSVMVAKTIEKQLKAQGIKATHSPVNQLAATGADLVICHRGLAQRAKQAVPKTVIVPFDMFLGDPAIARVIHDIQNSVEISDE